VLHEAQSGMLSPLSVKYGLALSVRCPASSLLVFLTQGLLARAKILK